MGKFALLIGVSDYEPGLTPLPATIKDAEEMQRVLTDPVLGGFDEAKELRNPTRQEMEEAIETLFSERAKDDLVLLFFSGHGIKDDMGRLYLATRNTRKVSTGQLLTSTAVSASFVQTVMQNARSRRQVVILDCCFGGAFAEGLFAKDDGTVDVHAQLGGEGRAILTSSTAAEYSFGQKDSQSSIYTKYLVEGIETGRADSDSDGVVSVGELHDYARKRIQEDTVAMKPQIYPVKEGFNIRLTQVPNPAMCYRVYVQSVVTREGDISDVGRAALEAEQKRLGLSDQEADDVETQVLRPLRKYQKNRQKYRKAFESAIREEEYQKNHKISDRTRKELRQLQHSLELSDEDVQELESQVKLQALEHFVPLPSNNQGSQVLSRQTASLNRRRLKIGAVLGLLLISLTGITVAYLKPKTLPDQNQPTDNNQKYQTLLEDAKNARNKNPINLSEVIELAKELKIDSEIDKKATPKDIIPREARDLIGGICLQLESEQDSPQFSKDYTPDAISKMETICYNVDQALTSKNR